MHYLGLVECEHQQIKKEKEKKKSRLLLMCNLGTAANLHTRESTTQRMCNEPAMMPLFLTCAILWYCVLALTYESNAKDCNQAC